MTTTPRILFLCVHNAGRSQMAAGFARALGAGRVEVATGGSEPAATVDPVAADAMAEAGIDVAAAEPRRWTDDELRSASVVVTMGCGDECPFIPGVRYEDWQVDDPRGRPIEDVRHIRDEIRRRVESLIQSVAGGE